eukprot:scaffold270_cov390-Prasinococcus_capsulatus_cf.AAC.2
MPTLSSSKRLALLLQLLLAASAVCAKFIGPYKMTFASSDPVAAQAYSEKYALVPDQSCMSVVPPCAALDGWLLA